MGFITDAIKFVKEHWIFFVVGLAVSIVAILIWMAVDTDPYQAIIVDKNWQRNVIIEEYRWVRESDTSHFSYPTAPSGARNIDRDHWVETIRHNAQYTTETYYTGEGENRKAQTRRVQTKAAWIERINHYRTSYEIQRWVYMQTLETKGGANIEPVFASYPEDLTPRIGRKEERYIFILAVDGKEGTKTYTSSDFALYSNTRDESAFIANINKFGFVLSIEPRRNYYAN